MPDTPAPTMRTSTWSAGLVVSGRCSRGDTLMQRGWPADRSFTRAPCPTLPVATGQIAQRGVAWRAMAARITWEPPSERVAALIRAGASLLLEEPAALCDQVDEAVLGATPARLSSDPAITAATVATNHANVLHWARANVRRPGAHVPANLSPSVLDLARDIVRRGLDDTTLNTYRIGQNVAWRAWMTLAFTLTDDPGDLRELLDITARSIFAFVDETVEGIQELIDREREQLTGGTHAERLETVNLILEGAPITSARAGGRLRYELGGRHTAAIAWADRDLRDAGALEKAAD